MIGAGEVVLALGSGDQEDADGFSRLHDNVGPAVGQQPFVPDFSRLQEGGRSELVHVLAAVLQPQFGGLAAVEGQVVGLETIIHHDDGHHLRMRPRIRRDRWRG